jgi:hypothetical protein
MGYRQAMYRGDYGQFRGDSIFSKIGKGIGSIARGAVSIGIGGPIAGGIARLFPGNQGAAGPGAPTFSSSAGPGTGLTVTRGVPSPGTSMTLPGGARMGVSPLGTLGYAPGPSMGRGQHPNRSGYWTSTGYVPKGTRMVSNRSTNYGNGHALKRALRRAHGFQHLARAVMSFTMTGKRHGAGHFKARRRSK